MLREVLRLVSTLLEILDDAVLHQLKEQGCEVEFQPFLRFWRDHYVDPFPLHTCIKFQPFLRFWPTRVCTNKKLFGMRFNPS